MKWEAIIDGLLPRNRIVCYGRAGVSRALHPMRLVPRVVRQVQGSKGHLRRARR
jgi:hypothetical protein